MDEINASAMKSMEQGQGLYKVSVHPSQVEGSRARSRQRAGAGALDGPSPKPFSTCAIFNHVTSVS